MKQMPPDMKHIILTNMNVKVYRKQRAYSVANIFSGSAAT